VRGLPGVREMIRESGAGTGPVLAYKCVRVGKGESAVVIQGEGKGGTEGQETTPTKKLRTSSGGLVSCISPR
jgi:hypothetical protein